MFHSATPDADKVMHCLWRVRGLTEGFKLNQKGSNTHKNKTIDYSVRADAQKNLSQIIIVFKRGEKCYAYITPISLFLSWNALIRAVPAVKKGTGSQGCMSLILLGPYACIYPILTSMYAHFIHTFYGFQWQNGTPKNDNKSLHYSSLYSYFRLFLNVNK